MKLHKAEPKSIDKGFKMEKQPNINSMMVISMRTKVMQKREDAKNSKGNRELEINQAGMRMNIEDRIKYIKVYFSRILVVHYNLSSNNFVVQKILRYIDDFY